MKIVGLVGPKRSGKDTAADALVKHRGFVKVGFADAVKELALRIDPIIDEDLCRLSYYVDNYGWENAKDYAEVRRLLQALGTDGVRDILGEDSWIDAWEGALCAALADGAPGVVVPDVRFLNEAESLKDRHLTEHLLIRITRPGLDLSDAHVSETEQRVIECDIEITNDTTTANLTADVLAAVDCSLGT